MITANYSVMHFFVDFLCAWGIFRNFQTGSGAYQNYLIYNFCAFALQMPLGILLDVLRSRVSDSLRPWLGQIWVFAGIFLTAAGVFTHPAILGVGNALFHVGAGLDVICEDFAKGHSGRSLGVFVAPGAVGLYLGTILGKHPGDRLSWLLSLSVLVILLAAMLTRQPREPIISTSTNPKKFPILLLCCFAVVVLRSWTGFQTNFDWKATVPFLAVLAVSSGKTLGGFASARFGHGRTMVCSLLLASICFLLGENPIFGLLGLLLFNMSMPVTLYLLAKHMPDTPGLAFGILTFGLFLGFLPVYADVTIPMSATFVCALGSIISAILLYIGWKAVKEHAVSA